MPAVFNPNEPYVDESEVIPPAAFDPAQPFEVETTSPPKSGFLRRYVGDPAVSLAKGIVSVPEAVVGLADIPTFGYAGKLLEAGGYGFQPKATKEIFSDLYSPEQKLANEKVQRAKGFFKTLGAMVENPSTIANTVIESVPAMLGGAGIARKLITSAPKIGALVGAAAGEGAVGAGLTAEQLRQESETGLITPKQAALSLTSGAATGLIGVLGGGLAKRLGITDIDTLLAGGNVSEQAAKKNILRRITESAITEGAFEELPQSAQEMWQFNLASGRPAGEGVVEAAASGLLAGLVMGGAGGFLGGRKTRIQTGTDDLGRPIYAEQTPETKPRPTGDEQTIPVETKAAVAPTLTLPDYDPENLGKRELISRQVAGGKSREQAVQESSDETKRVWDWISNNTKDGDVVQNKNGQIYWKDSDGTWLQITSEGVSVGSVATPDGLRGGKIIRRGVKWKAADNLKSNFKKTKVGDVEREDFVEPMTESAAEEIAPAETPEQLKDRIIRERVTAGIPPENFQFTVSKDPAVPKFGYVQVDEIDPTLPMEQRNVFSSNIAKLKSLGVELPTEAELLSLPTGRYTLVQAREKLAEQNKPIEQTPFVPEPEAPLTPLPEGNITLYRWEQLVKPEGMEENPERGLWFGSNPAEVEQFKTMGGTEKRLIQVTIPSSEAAQYRRSETGFVVSPEIAERARTAKPTSPQVQTGRTVTPEPPAQKVVEPEAPSVAEVIGSFVADGKDSTGTWIKENVPVLSVGEPVKLARPTSDGGWRVSFEVPSTMGKTGRQERSKFFFKKADALTWIDEVKQSKPAQPLPNSPTGGVAKAVEKVAAEVTEVAKTDGQRSAKEVKTELVTKLEKAIGDAPSVSDLLAKETVEVNSGQWANGKPIMERKPLMEVYRPSIKGEKPKYEKEYLAALDVHAKKVTIDIPGDGTFRIVSTKEALAELLVRAKRLSVSAGEPTRVKYSGTSKADKEWIAEQVEQQKPTTSTSGEGGGAQFSLESGRESDNALIREPDPDANADKAVEQAGLHLARLLGARFDQKQIRRVGRHLRDALPGTLESEAIKRLEQSFGRQVIFVDFGRNFFRPNGMILESLPGYIFINAKTKKAVLAVAGHELLEHLRVEQPALYQEALAKLKPLMPGLDEYFAKLLVTYDLNGVEAPKREDAEKELIADFFGDSLMDENFWPKLAAKDPSLFQRLARTVLDFLNQLIAKLKGFGSYEYFSDIEKAHDVVADALAKFAKERPTVAGAGDAQFSLEPTGAEEDFAPDEKVQIAGRDYTIVSKERLTPAQKTAGDERAREYLGNELKLPGQPDLAYGKEQGSTDRNTVFTIIPDGNNHDDAGMRLTQHLIDQIQQQNSPGGSPSYVSSLVNAINKNFDLGRFNGVFSEPVLERLLEYSVGESSRRGSMLRAITGIRDNIVAIAQNAKLRLKWVYADAFGGELARKMMDKIASNFRESFSGDEIERLYNANPKLRELFNNAISRIKAKPSLREVIEEIFKTPIFHQDQLVEKFVETMVNKFSATPEEAARLKVEFNQTFAASFKAAREKAQLKALADLTPEERKIVGPTTPLWKKITNLVNAGGFDSGKLMTDAAKENRWNIPTESELAQMREWSSREQALREPSPEEIEKAGGDAEKARELVEAATLEKRQELLRKMNAQWSRWTKPVITRWRDITDPEKRYNTATAANEWLAANLLLKIGFGTRQIVDVATQMILHTPTRAVSYAFEQWSNDKSAGRVTNLFNNISEAMLDAYKVRSKVLKDTLNASLRTLKGRGEQKNVEQLLSAIAVFDRSLLRAEQLRAQGKPAAARFFELLAITLRFGRQFAAAADVIQGIPAEAQEIAHQIRTGLRERDLTKAERDLQYDSILGLLTTARAESLSEARQILESRGLDTSNSSVQRAAWHILREKVYQMANRAGMATDDWKAQNAYYRNVIGWNEPETKGLGRGKLGGPGGLVALGARAGKELFARGGIPGFLSVFGNAIGISINRKLAYTPLGFFPGVFKGSPWFEGERNQRQRKVEATIGTTVGSVLFGLAALGIITVLSGRWPRDEKEKAEWIAKGYKPGMMIIPWGDGQEVLISSTVGPMGLFSPYLAAGGAVYRANIEQARKQQVANEKAARLGAEPEQISGLDAMQWLGIAGQAGYAATVGGRTASGMVGSYTDFGAFNPKKVVASAVSGMTPGLPGYQELSRMAGANLDPKLASFWDLLVPMPTSDANRVNVLGDPMRTESNVQRIFQVLTGGTYPFPIKSAEFKENVAYANLFNSEYRPPSINPGRGYVFGNKLRPMSEDELVRYTKLRGESFKAELSELPLGATAQQVEGAFKIANARALSTIGARPAVQSSSSSAPSMPKSVSVSQPDSGTGLSGGRSAFGSGGFGRSRGRVRSAFGRRTRLSTGRSRGRMRLATMRIAKLKRSGGRVRMAMARIRKPRLGRVRSSIVRNRLRRSVAYV